MSSTTVVVAGSMAQRTRRSGHAWLFLQYALGLQRLGHDVVLVDRLDRSMCTDERGVTRSIADVVRWAFDAAAAQGLDDRYALAVGDDWGDATWVGPGRDAVTDRIRDGVVIDVMGFLGDHPLVDGAAARVFVDLDPGFTQLWDLHGLTPIPREHDRYLTVGTALPLGTSDVPDRGISWQGTLPPVLLDVWKTRRAPSTEDPVTMIGSWRGLAAPVEHEGRRLGLRAHTMRPFASLPDRLSSMGPGSWTSSFDAHLDLHPADSGDADTLRSGGWTLFDPLRTGGALVDYRRIIRTTGVGICLPKALHVSMRTGWFSDRSATWLAAGRPVVALDTGVTGLPSDEGFVTFEDPDDAAAVLDGVRSDLARHAKAARALAEEHLDSGPILTSWLEGLGT